MNLDEVLGKSLSWTGEARANPSARARFSLEVPLGNQPEAEGGSARHPRILLLEPCPYRWPALRWPPLVSVLTR